MRSATPGKDPGDNACMTPEAYPEAVPADRSRLRPDIMLVEMTQAESMVYRRHSQRHRELSTTMNSQTRADGP